MRWESGESFPSSTDIEILEHLSKAKSENIEENLAFRGPMFTLYQIFKENFKEYESYVDEKVIKAGPVN